MKKIISTLFSLVFTIGLFAQQAPPHGINYQAMVYVPYGNQQVGVNSAGQIPANTQQVVVKFTLEEGNNGPVIYEETHTDTTDQYGLLNTVIGTGTPTSNSPGLFNQIDWSMGDPHLRVSITLTQYNSTVSSYQKLWSVPYALYADHANTADFATNSGHADSSDYADLAGNGITGVIDNGNGTLTFNYLDGSSYTTPVLTGLMGAQGPQGPAGSNGLSAYDLWLAQGNTGTIADFLNSLQGATGSQGPIGLTGPQGATGPAGPQGTPGSQNAWSLTGNAGTNPSTNFIGTTDAQDWVIKTNNTERIRVTTDGKVGIGTDMPATTLSIVSQMKPLTLKSLADGCYMELFTPGFNSGNTRGAWFGFGNSTTSHISLNNVTPTGSIFFNTVSQTRLTINNIGNVGIGTTNPLGKLHVNNDVSGSDSSFIVTTGGNVGIGTSSPISPLEIVGQFTSRTTTSPASIHKIYDLNNFQRFSNNVNFSSTITQYDFDVFSPTNTSDVNVRFFRSTNTTGTKKIDFMRGDGTTTASAVIAVDGGNSYFQNHGGNFGIGTSSPAWQFQVGNASNNGFVALQGDATNGNLLRYGGTGTNAGVLRFVGQSDIESMRIADNGNVGIGTSSPESKLHIVGISNAVGMATSTLTIEANDPGYLNGSIVFKSKHTDANKRGNGIFFFNQQGQNEWYFGRPYSGNSLTTPNDEIVIQRLNTSIHNEQASGLVDGSGNATGTTRFLTIKNNGNVGIGTSTPARTLHINAVMRLEPIATAPASPAKGDMYFDSTINKLRVFDGTVWQNCW